MTAARQISMFDHARDGGDAPVSGVAAAHDDPAALALEIATDLRAAEVAIAGVAAELAPTKAPYWSDRLKAALERQVERANQDMEEMRALHAEILGVPVEQLDAKLAEQRAAEEAERSKRKAQRPPPAPRASKRGRTKAAAAEPAQPPTARLTDRQRELLGGFEVRGNVARFTSDEHQADWVEVKKVFLALGAKWTKGGFRFPVTDDGAEKVRLALATGEIFDPKAAGFFPTPEPVVTQLVAAINPGMRVLEPSAGRGAIALAARRHGAEVTCFELMPDNAAELRRLGFEVIEGDFIGAPPRPEFDAVLMNPPFADQLSHIRRAFEWVKPSGFLHSVAGASVMFREDAAHADFRAWVESLDGRIDPLPDGSFLDSGTGVRTCTVLVGKPG